MCVPHSLLRYYLEGWSILWSLVRCQHPWQRVQLCIHMCSDKLCLSLCFFWGVLPLCMCFCSATLCSCGEVHFFRVFLCSSLYCAIVFRCVTCCIVQLCVCVDVGFCVSITMAGLGLQPQGNKEKSWVVLE